MCLQFPIDHYLYRDSTMNSNNTYTFFLAGCVFFTGDDFATFLGDELILLGDDTLPLLLILLLPGLIMARFLLAATRIGAFFTGEGAFFPVSSGFLIGEDDTFGVDVIFCAFPAPPRLVKDVSFFCTKVLFGETIFFCGDGDDVDGDDVDGDFGEPLGFLEANFRGVIAAFLGDATIFLFPDDATVFRGEDTAAFFGDATVFLGEGSADVLDEAVLFWDLEEGIFLGDDDEDTDDTTEEAGDDDEIKGDSILVLPERVDLVPLLVPNL